MRPWLTAIFSLILCLLCSAAVTAQRGKLKLNVLDELGAGAKPAAQIFAADGSKVGEVAPGASVELPAGTYKLVLPVVGGSIVREGVLVEPGRVHTVLIASVAVLNVSARNAAGPQQVDVKVDVPPQGYLWHAVMLRPGHRAALEFKEEQPAELIVRTTLVKAPVDKRTRVVIYQAGTQKQTAVSAPGAEHRFTLDAGNYDIYVENQSGKGRPYTMERSVHLESGQKVERQVALDGESTANGK